eukprot:GEMP01090674.1.p2 GENE.GEMP01090674.1~~GEMP01090674.1.p2  ORF type:complete len:119 (+),score=18.00 GEMP01090674.1:349-705(+)
MGSDGSAPSQLLQMLRQESIAIGPNLAVMRQDALVEQSTEEVMWHQARSRLNARNALDALNLSCIDRPQCVIVSILVTVGAFVMAIIVGLAWHFKFRRNGKPLLDDYSSGSESDVSDE